MTLGLFFFGVLAGAVPDSVFDNAAAWVSDSVDGPLTIEKRPVEGSPYSEYRIITVCDVPVDTLCDVVFEWGTRDPKNPTVSFAKLLKDGEAERVVYAQIDAPLISTRDYAMTVRKDHVGERVCRIRFKVTNEEAPAPQSSMVRMEKMWGSWVFEPLPEGKTKLTYLLFADPSGSVPTFLVHGGQKKGAKDSVLTALQKGREANKAQK